MFVLSQRYRVYAKAFTPNMTIFGEGACEEVMWVEWSHNDGALLQQG